MGLRQPEHLAGLELRVLVAADRKRRRVRGGGDLDTLPGRSGSAFTVVVTVGLDAPTSGLGVAEAGTGARVSAGEARRLACAAGIIPMVLDGASVPLDLGRERRLFSHHLHPGTGAAGRSLGPGDRAVLETVLETGVTPMKMPKPTDADKDRFRALVPEHPDVEVKPMFGNLGAFVRGTMFAGLFGSAVGVKLDADGMEELRRVDGSGPFGPEERPMGGYLSLPDAYVDDPALGTPWMQRALDHVATLPPKVKRQKGT